MCQTYWAQKSYESFLYRTFLGPLCNSWLCILCIFFRNFSGLQDIHSWLNSAFHFSNMSFFQQMASTFSHHFFWIETHIQQENVPRSFLKEKFTPHHHSTGNLDGFQKQTQGMHHPTWRFCRYLNNKASSMFFVAVSSTFCWDGCDFSICARFCP